MWDPVVELSDDAGGRYIAREVGSLTGPESNCRVSIAFAPAPEDRARVLTVIVVRFEDPVVPGPWRFEVALR